MDAAKIRLSSKELELVSNADWILTKNRIIDKVIALFASLQADQQAFIHSRSGEFPNEVISSTPKISRGEKYEGLPYVMLDYPRHFVQEDILAIRTLFWWGHYFSVTLHVSGRFKKMLEKPVLAEITMLKNNGYFICIDDDAWKHNLHTVNYAPVADLDKKEMEKIVGEKSFLKLACKISLDQWSEELLLVPFKQLADLLNNK